MVYRYSWPLAYLAICWALLAGPALASSKCVIIPMSNVNVWELTYDPLMQSVAMGVFEFKVENAGDTPCNIKASTKLVTPRFGLRHEDNLRRIRPVLYTLHNDDTGVVLTPITGSSPEGGGQPLHLDKHRESGAVNVRYAVSPGMIPAGVYEQEIILVLEDSHSVLEQVIKLRLNVVPSALMGLKGRFMRRGSTAVIDLGELTSGTRSLDTKLYVQSTGRYRVTVSSANGGYLRQGRSEWSIPYTLTVGTSTLSMAGEQVITSDDLSNRIDDYNLMVNIGSIDGVRAGHYRDTVTFTLAAL